MPPREDIPCGSVYTACWEVRQPRQQRVPWPEPWAEPQPEPEQPQRPGPEPEPEQPERPGSEPQPEPEQPEPQPEPQPTAPPRDSAVPGMGADMQRARAKARERYADFCTAQETAAAGPRVCHSNALSSYWAEEDAYDAERSVALVLRAFLSHVEVDAVHAAGATAQAKERAASSNGGSCAFMALLPSHLRPNYSAHIKSFLHRGDDFCTTQPALSHKIISGMKAQPGSWGPELRDGIDLHVRCIEYHSYREGGGLVAPGHCDNGSVMTLSVMLSKPEQLKGGDFVTFTDGELVAHALEKGDAILFRSEKHHNVTTVRAGLRQSLVVELWAQPPNLRDRFS